MGMTSLHDLSSPYFAKNRPCLKGNANRMENEIKFFISYPEVPLSLYKGNANRMENEIIFLFLILRCRLLYTEVIIIFNMKSKVCFFINIFIKQSAQVPHSMSVIPFPTNELFYSPTDIIYSPTDITESHRSFLRTIGLFIRGI